MTTSSTKTTFSADPYASRLAEKWEAVERVDPVIWNDRYAGPLDRKQLDRFQQDGLLSIEQLVGTDEAHELLATAKRLAAEANPNDESIVMEPGGGAVRSIFRVHRTNERFRALCGDSRLVEVARQILGSDVYIHQSRINFKPGFTGKEFFWHSDFETWHMEDGMPRMRALSMSLSLTANHLFNGPLMLVPGSHRTYLRCAGETPDHHYRSSLKKQEYGVPSRDALRLLIERSDGIQAATGSPGSAILFDCNTMHGSVANLSPDDRTNLFVVFNSIENKLVEPFGGKPPRPAFLAER